MSNFIKKINLLPEDLKVFVFSDTPMQEIKRSFEIYAVKSALSEKIAKEIGLTYINDLEIKNLPELLIDTIGTNAGTSYGIAFEINKRIFNKFPDYFKDSTELLEQWGKLKSTPLISEDEAWKKVLELEPWILEEEQEKNEERKIQEEEIRKRQAQLEKLTIQIALKNYPEINEQLITADFIKLASFFEPVRPSIKNWLADYNAVLYGKRHDSISRNDYLFHQKNTQNLSADDRNRLSYILKALDENSLITVDKNAKKILFPVLQTHQKPSELSSNTTQSPFRSLAPNAQQTPASKISYSSPQKLPYEKIATPAKNITPVQKTTPQPYRITPFGGGRNVIDTKKIERELPKNTVDLRTTD